MRLQGFYEAHSWESRLFQIHAIPKTMDLQAWLPSDWPSRILLAVVPAAVVALIRWLGKSRRKQYALEARIDSTTVIDDLQGNPALKIQYSGLVIRNLQSTLALVWSAGREPVRRENVAPARPIELTFPEGTQILEARVLYQSRKSTALQIDSRGDKVHVDFDYLNPNDAFLLHCIHTGSPDEVLLEGELIGSSVQVDSNWTDRAGVHGAEVGVHTKLVDMRRLRNLSSIATLVIVCALIAAALFESWLVVGIVAGVQFALVLLSFWPFNSIPRQVRQELQEFFREQNKERQATE